MTIFCKKFNSFWMIYLEIFFLPMFHRDFIFFFFFTKISKQTFSHSLLSVFVFPMLHCIFRGQYLFDGILYYFYGLLSILFLFYDSDLGNARVKIAITIISYIFGILFFFLIYLNGYVFWNCLTKTMFYESNKILYTIRLKTNAL